MNEGRIIGVDHGYAAMKTANFIFPTGLAAYDYPPYTLKDTLEYDGKYYVVGNERQRLQRDKTLTDDSYLMTLAAICGISTAFLTSIWRRGFRSPGSDGNRTLLSVISCGTDSPRSSVLRGWIIWSRLRK